VQYGGGDHLKSAEIAKTILQAHPNLKGIFGANEGSAEGVAIGVRESGKKVVIIGYDAGKEQKDAIRSGAMYGAITQNPIGIGKCTVEEAVKALKGEKLSKVIDTGFYYYDKTTSTIRRSPRCSTTDQSTGGASQRRVRHPASRCHDVFFFFLSSPAKRSGAGEGDRA